MNNNILEFNMLKPESLKAFAMVLSEFQSRAVNFKVTQDSNIAYIEIFR